VLVNGKILKEKNKRKEEDAHIFCLKGSAEHMV